MSKKILIISTSLRNNSNSKSLADAFEKGVSKAGGTVEKISLKDKKILFCTGCLSCQKNGKCMIKDDMVEIIEKIKSADILVFATPIYYYEMSGQMKVLLDRTNPLYSNNYSFRKVYLLTTASEDSKETDNNAINGIKGWIECFEKAEFSGSVFAGGVTNSGDIKDHPSLEKAYKLGCTSCI